MARATRTGAPTTGLDVDADLARPVVRRAASPGDETERRPGERERGTSANSCPVHRAQGPTVPFLVALTGQLSNPYAPLLRLLHLNRDDEAAVALAVGRPMTLVSGVVKQVQRRLTLEQQADVVRRYEAGAQMSYLATHFGVHRSTVSAILKRNRVSTRKSGLSANQIDEAAVLYRQGKSLAVIGSELGVDAGTVHDRLREQGVIMRDTHGRER